MSLGLIFVGLVLTVAAIRNKQGDLFTLLKGDFTGQNNFIEWILAIVLVGALGYIPKVRPLSIALLTLVLLAIFLKKGTGFFAQLNSTVNGLTAVKQ